MLAIVDRNFQGFGKCVPTPYSDIAHLTQVSFIRQVLVKNWAGQLPDKELC